ncbi:hypothetical protein OG21DRAFT_1525925 [Imleria badia]|nr:hypothetical protein OG21DRAFT_1525925 [Imleria badia]
MYSPRQGGGAQPQADICKDKSQPSRKSQVLVKVNKWTPRVGKEHKSDSLARSSAPSASTATLVPPSTSTGATSIEYDDCDNDMDEKEAYGGFGEDGDDSLEQEAAQMATSLKENQSLVELTQVPPRLWERQAVLKRKVCDSGNANDAPGIMTDVESDHSGAKTEPDETREGSEGEHECPHVNMAGRRLTAASWYTNQTCINVLAWLAKRVKTDASTTASLSTRSAVSKKNAPSNLSNTHHASLTPSTTPLDPGPSHPATTSGSQVRYIKANLPPVLLQEGGCNDIWDVGWASITYALPLIIDFHPATELDSSMMDFSWQGPIVSVAHQRVAMVISLLQSASSDDEVRDMADILLEDCSFLYKDLDAGCPEKAFRSNLVLQLLNATHLHGIIGLYAAACPHEFTDSVLLRLERALTLASNGHIMHKMIQVVEGKNGIPKMPIRTNPQSSRESNAVFSFSDQHWGKRTRKLTSRMQKRTATQIRAIVEEARLTRLTFAASHESIMSSEMDQYNHICKSSIVVAGHIMESI